ncbi:cobalt ECF transporter T component CbiQ [Methanobrevibacter sp. TMH8]|uniref:cobalt ECF transporter T component CbiQ n=1 Tax=Methanobrevibacter sp. TMH8 TaxID=2848611 RepID=UPI001CCC0A24|nr:cobalt ECF transporter T component CbiQ [Methanobrevibacter sp. TMH8]
MEIDYIAHTNELRNVNSTFKFIFAIFLMVFALIVNLPIVSLIITFFIAFLLLFVARVPFRFYIKFISIPFGFSLITCIFLAFFFGTGPIIFHTGIFGIVVREDALTLAITTFFRTLACFSALGFLSSTTPISEILNDLKKIKVPKIFIEIALLMYNIIFVFLDQIKIMTNAQKTRMGYNGIKNSYRSLGLLITNLFFKSLEKSEHLQHALDSRGYNGELPKYNP